MKTVVYYVLTMNESKDNEREEKLNQFLKKYKLNVENIYYDILNIPIVNEKKGIDNLLKDLQKKEVVAEAFVAMSINDLGKDNFIDIIAEINRYIPYIYFTEIED